MTYSSQKGFMESVVALGVDTASDAPTALPVRNNALQVEFTNQTYPVSVSLPLNGDAITQVVYIVPEACVLVGASYVHATAGTHGGAVTSVLSKESGTTAPGAGTALMTNTFNCKGTANTVQNAALSADAAVLALAAGNRVSVAFTGTTTSLAGVTITLLLRKA